MSDQTWYNIIEIALLLASCYACYYRGQIAGVELLATELIENKIIRESDLDKLLDQ